MGKKIVTKIELKLAEPMDFRFRTININTHLDQSIDFAVRGIPVVAEIYSPQRKKDYYPNAVNS